MESSQAEEFSAYSEFCSSQTYQKCNNNYCSNTLLPLGEGLGDEVVRKLPRLPAVTIHLHNFRSFVSNSSKDSKITEGKFTLMIKHPSFENLESDSLLQIKLPKFYNSGPQWLKKHRE